jgi:cytochrome c biogenesis protein CcmG/thiol:disulfide interchange protein DsbE
MSVRRAGFRARMAVAVIVALSVALSGCSATDAKHEQGAATLPHTTLAGFDGGKSLDLSTLRGPAVVNLWASWCGPCRKELPLYQSFAKKYAGKVDVIGIDFQDTQQGQARQLIRQTGVTYPLYRDPDGTMRARVLPQLILVDEEGSVAHEMYIEITSVAQLEKLVATHLGVSG